MTADLKLRLARPSDLDAVDALLARSYPRLLAPDYPPGVMAAIVPILSRARPELLASGRYFVVTDAGGAVRGAGGYSLTAPGARGQAAGPRTPGTAHIRHVACDPDAVRRGIGSLIMQAVFASGALDRVQRFDCLSTLTAVPFYTAMEFRVIGPQQVPILADSGLDVMRMQRDMP